MARRAICVSHATGAHCVVVGQEVAERLAFQYVDEVISEAAERGSVVIVAHAVSFAADGGDVLRVLITASAKTRAERLMADRGLDSREAERAIKASDAGRADYLKRFYGVDQELPTHYEVVVNTDVLTAADAANIIVAAG